MQSNSGVPGNKLKKVQRSFGLELSLLNHREKERIDHSESPTFPMFEHVPRIAMKLEREENERKRELDSEFKKRRKERKSTHSKSTMTKDRLPEFQALVGSISSSRWPCPPSNTNDGSL